jgi:hypothetical protein
MNNNEEAQKRGKESFDLSLKSGFGRNDDFK